MMSILPLSCLELVGPSGCKTGISPVPSAKHIKPMTTLIEEQAKPLLNRSQDDDVSLHLFFRNYFTVFTCNFSLP